MPKLRQSKYELANSIFRAALKSVFEIVEESIVF